MIKCREPAWGAHALHLASHSTSAGLYGAARAAQTLRSAVYSKERRTFVANGGSGDWYDRVRAYFRGEVY